MITARDRALAAGHRAFGHKWRPHWVAAAPGRLELLGNHVDYNGGPVLAAAIDRTVVVLVEEKPGQSASIEAAFADEDPDILVEVDSTVSKDWRNDSPPPVAADYLRGAVAALGSRPHIGLKTGVRLAIAGDVPIGFGLSSSAALCVALTQALSRQQPGHKELVLAAQEAEHRAGTPCGAMDQSASVAGGIILFEAATLDITRLTPELSGYTFAVADSGVERSLGSSSYPVRVNESREVLEFAQRHIRADLDHLAALQPRELDELQSRFGAELRAPLLRRAKHVITETRRVVDGLSAVEAEDWPCFGRLMTESGRSSAVDYEISHPRVEELVSDARSVSGVVGARMMGGGEGGTALILLERDAVPSLEAALRSGYYRRHAIADQPDLVHVFGFARGARIERWSSISN